MTEQNLSNKFIFMFVIFLRILDIIKVVYVEQGEARDVLDIEYD